MLIYRYRTKPLLVPPWVSLAAFAAATALIYAIPSLRGNLFKSQPDFLQVDVFAMIWLAPLLPYVAGSLRLKSSPLDRHVGNLAYPLYLVHFPILHAFGLTGLGEKLLVSGLAFGVALLLYVLVDVPIEKGRYASLDALIRARARQQRAVAT
jgi:peptidoglycan/LPS O-acetylase OafA/YrhL